ncbi:hypothetical protein BKA81DRAFT_58585 [Phyllosticta paracitricarpa]
MWSAWLLSRLSSRLATEGHHKHNHSAAPTLILLTRAHFMTRMLLVSTEPSFLRGTSLAGSTYSHLTWADSISLSLMAVSYRTARSCNHRPRLLMRLDSTRGTLSVVIPSEATNKRSGQGFFFTKPDVPSTAPPLVCLSVYLFDAGHDGAEAGGDSLGRSLGRTHLRSSFSPAIMAVDGDTRRHMATSLTLTGRRTEGQITQLTLVFFPTALCPHLCLMASAHGIHGPNGDQSGDCE